MRLIVMTFIALLVAAVSGFGSVWLALGEYPPTAAVQIGQWRTWPGMGSAGIDPYARAIILRTAALPLGAGEGVEFTAGRDSDGQKLTGRCAYLISGMTPEARIWTLTASPATGRLSPPSASENSEPPKTSENPDNPASTAATSLTSDGLLRAPGGAVHVTASATASPGDWLAVPPDAPFRLTLRLYDTPTGFNARPNVAGQVMPTITRGACG